MKQVFYYLQLLGFSILISCEPSLDEVFEVYTINKNEHYCSGRGLETLQSSVLTFKAKFDGSAQYNLGEEYQNSKNKLLGFSDCNSEHHENSARFAWQWNNDVVEIYAYCYNNGKRTEVFLGSVSIDEIANYRLELTEASYIFLFKQNRVEIPRTANCNVGVYYMLWPYFGGRMPAPHDITIAVQRF